MKQSASFYLMMFLCLQILGCVSTPVKVVNPPPPLAIVEIAPSERTHATKAALLSLLKKYDLLPYFFTSNIQIQAFVIPHSAPILTLNTKEYETPDFLLSTFIHEELHWFVDAHPDGQKRAITEFKKMYPTLPLESEKIASDFESTYDHITVCYLELQGLKAYLGSKRAYEVAASIDHYTWIYGIVMKDEAKIKAVLARNGLDHI